MADWFIAFLETQNFHALVPQGHRETTYKQAQLVDIEYDSNGKPSIFKFRVDPAIHPGGVIMVLRGFMSFYLATDELQRQLKKAKLRDQQTREIRNRFLYEEGNGPKKLRTMR